jgi:hypothetical protein
MDFYETTKLSIQSTIRETRNLQHSMMMKNFPKGQLEVCSQKVEEEEAERRWSFLVFFDLNCKCQVIFWIEFGVSLLRGGNFFVLLGKTL